MAAGLTEQQISESKQRLQRRGAQLREEVRRELLKSDAEQYIELAGRVHDLEEESVADLLADVNLAMIDLHINEIRAIEAALLRIAGGMYGVCIDCDGDIGYERLRATPTAKRCRDCQAKYERNYSKTGGPRL